MTFLWKAECSYQLITTHLHWRHKQFCLWTSSIAMASSSVDTTSEAVQETHFNFCMGTLEGILTIIVVLWHMVWLWCLVLTGCAAQGMSRMADTTTTTTITSEEGVTVCVRLIRSFEYRNIKVICEYILSCWLSKKNAFSEQGAHCEKCEPRDYSSGVHGTSECWWELLVKCVHTWYLPVPFQRSREACFLLHSRDVHLVRCLSYPEYILNLVIHYDV